MSEARVKRLNEFGRDRLPGLLGLEILECSAERVTGRIPVTPPLIAGTGFLWAPVVIALADTLCAYGAGETRPPDSRSFTTVELKTNFLGTVGAGGAIAGDARPAHLFFLVVAPPLERDPVYLKLMAEIVRAVRLAKTRQRLLDAPDFKAVRRILIGAIDE